jgi:hypothetical protein
MMCELGELLPMDIVQLISYTQNVGAVLGLTATGSMVNEKAASTYLLCTGRLRGSLFSDEYMKTNQEIREVFLRGNCHSLNDEAMDRVCLLSKWQSENFLSHLNATALDGCGITPTLVTMSDRQLDTTGATMGSQPVTACKPQPMPSTVNNDYTDEEKLDVSEKAVNKEEPVNSIPKQLSMGAQKDICVANLLLELSKDSFVSCSELLSWLPNLKGPEELSLVRNCVAGLIDEKRSQIGKLEREISDIEAVMGESTADVVVETLQRELNSRQQEFQMLSRRVSELQRVKLSFRNICKCGKLMELDVGELWSFLNGCLSIYKHQTEGLAQLVACVVNDGLFTDGELKQL